MKAANDELKTGEPRPEAIDELQDPEEVVTGERTRDHFYDVALTLREPATVDEIADRAGHGPSTAREYMLFFETQKIVKHVSTDPDQFITNKNYLNWKHALKIKEEYHPRELAEMHDRIEGRISEFKQNLKADHPDNVEVGRATTDLNEPATEIINMLSEWRTDRRRLQIVKDALNQHGNSPASDDPLYA